jgi:hypothetical protein
MAGICVGIALSAITAFSVGPYDGTFQKLAVSAGVLGASVASGAFLGFVFGVPKVPQSAPSGDESGKNPEAGASRYEQNSNLEQISDWLAKIIVGAGLIQIRAIGEGLWNISLTLGGFFDGGRPSTLGGAIYSATLIVSGLLASFNLTYMWSRTRFYVVIDALRGQ